MRSSANWRFSVASLYAPERVLMFLYEQGSARLVVMAFQAIARRDKPLEGRFPFRERGYQIVRLGHICTRPIHSARRRGMTFPPPT